MTEKYVCVYLSLSARIEALEESFKRREEMLVPKTVMNLMHMHNYIMYVGGRRS